MSLPVVAITGGASGIGLELARRLAPTHRVALLDINLERAQQAAAQLGPNAIAVPCDITSQASVSAAVATVVERFGRIDIAVSNAGIGTVGAARHLDPDVLAAQLGVNVTGNWRFMHACLPHLVRSRGYLLGIASAAAITSPPAEGFYSASKAGLEALLNVVRVEVAHLGVAVGIGYLMFIDTPMVREGDRQHSDLATLRAMLPGPAGKTYPVSLAADRLAKGVRRRAKRIFVPSSLRWQYYLRGLLGPVTDRSFAKIAPQVDRLTLAKVTEKGALAAAFNYGPAPDSSRTTPTPGFEASTTTTHPAHRSE
jgi:NAD(P)-dependent dehydrogenase (short-subunit alcohol dehydrogenase family)